MKKIVSRIMENKIASILIAVIIVASVTTSVIVVNNSKKAGNTESMVVSIEDDTTPLADTVTEPEKEEVKETTSVSGETPEEMAEEVFFVKEGYELINGNFEDGINGFEFYSLISDNAYYTINNGIDITILDTGSEDWHVQLKQNNVRLVQGNWYRLTLQAKSTVNRTIGCSFMHDGTNDDNWTGYSENARFALTNSWKTFSIVFQMSNPTDNAVFNLALGTVDGRHITSEHTVSINNIKLENLGAHFTDTMKTNGNLIGNGDFSFENILWETVIVAPGRATSSFEGNKATFNITNPGTEDWNVQLKQSGVSLEKDQCYRLTFDAASTVARNIKIGFMDTGYVNWYGGGEAELTAEKKTITLEFQNTIASDANAVFMLSMGKLEGENTPASTITLENISLVKIDALSGSGVIKKFHDGWQLYDHEAKHVKDAYYSVADGFVVEVADPGKETWHIQLTNRPIALYGGKTYKFSFEAKASIRRNITAMIQHDGEFNGDDRWDTYTTNNKVELTTEWKRYNMVFTMPYDDTATIANFSLGYDNTDYLTWFDYIGVNKVYIKNMSVVEYNSSFKGFTNYYEKSANADASFDINDNDEMVATVKNGGTEMYHVQLTKPDVSIVKGNKYRVTFDAKSEIDRKMEVAFQLNGEPWTTYYSEAVDLTKDYQPYTVEFTSNVTDAKARLNFSMGNVAGAEALKEHKITIKNFKLEDLGKAEEKEELGIGVEMLLNKDFSMGDKNWIVTVMEPGVADITFENGIAVFDISAIGTEDWHVNIKQSNLKFVEGATYEVVLNATSSVRRDIQVGIMVPSEDYKWLGGSLLTVGPDTTEPIKFQFTSAGSTDVAIMQISMGDVPKGDCKPAKISIDSVSIKKVKEASSEIVINKTDAMDGDHWTYFIKASDIAGKDVTGKTIKVSADIESTGFFKGQLGMSSTGEKDWYNDWREVTDGTKTTFSVIVPNCVNDPQVQIFDMAGDSVKISNISVVIVDDESGNDDPDIALNNNGIYVHEGTGADAKENDTTEDGVKVIGITNGGSDTWHVQYTVPGIKLEKDKSYRLSYDIMSTVDRTTQHSFFLEEGKDNFFANWYISLKGNEWKHVVNMIEMNEDTVESATLKFLLGNSASSSFDANDISIKNLILEEVTDPLADYYLAAIGGTDSEISDIVYDNSSKTFTIKKTGTADWNVLLQKTGLKLENGKAYNVSFKVKSSVNRSASVILQTVKKNDNNEDVYKNHYYKGLNLEADTWAEVNDSFFMFDETEDAVIYQMNFGKFGDEELGEHEITIKDLSIKEASTGFVNELDGNEYEFFAVGSSAAKREFSFPEFEGKKVKVSAKVTSDNNNFGGCMGYSLLGKWTQDERGGYADGESFIEWSTTIDVFSGSFELQFWWNSFPVIVSEVTVTELETNSQAPTDYKGFHLNINDGEAKATNTVGDDFDTVSIGSVGTANYHLQLQKSGLSLEKDHYYSVEFDVLSDVNRYIQYMIQEPVNYSSCDAEWDLQLTANETKHFKRFFKMNMDSAGNYNLNLSLGKHNADSDLGEHTLTISNFEFKEIADSYKVTLEDGYEMLRVNSNTAPSFNVDNSDLIGKTVIITMDVSSEKGGFNGGIGTSNPNWLDQAQSDASEWAAVIENYPGWAVVQLYWSDAPVTFTNISIAEYVAPEMEMFMLLPNDFNKEALSESDDEEALLPKEEETDSELDEVNDIYLSKVEDAMLPEEDDEADAEDTFEDETLTEE